MNYVDSIIPAVAIAGVVEWQPRRIIPLSTSKKLKDLVEIGILGATGKGKYLRH